MDAARLDRIQDLFLAALEHPPGARAAFLDDACDDPGLRRAVEEYLAADALDDAFILDEPLVRLPAEEPPPEGDSDGGDVEGRRVGPYRLIRLLGRGGMGAVYLAVHEDVGREVALKVVRGDLADPTARQRFLFERRVLARLEHPNIARLYDAGVDDDGTPYFAMEMVEGVPLTDFCDRERLGLDDRLRLFERVGRTVQHAHQHFVVHRDLKPSNILVTPEGGVKLLDFGIAKALDEAEEGLEADHRTATGRSLLTPAYAAPEQHAGGAVTAATDVYSLGVVLFELLTGKRPEAPTGVTHEPPRPSTAVTEDETADTATARQTTADRLVRRLRGDLDVICLKALQPEPERRYASAEAFVEDVKRHLAGLPVTARPDAAGYRLRKFIRRHRRGVLATAAAVATLALVVGFYTVQLQAERDRALREARKAEQVTALLTRVLSAADPFGAEGPDVPVGRVLEAGASELRAELQGQPDVLAAVLEVLGGIESNWGRSGEALALLEEAYAITGAHEVGPAVESAVLHGLANAYIEDGRYVPAEPLLRRALALQRERLGTDDPAVASAYNDLASAVQYQGRLDEAVGLYERAVAIRRTLPPSTDFAANLNNLANVLGDLGRHEEAIPLYLEAREIVLSELGEGHPYDAYLSNALTISYGAVERYDEALREADRAAAAVRNRLDEDHPLAATVLHNRGGVLRHMGRYEDARSTFEAAIALRRGILAEGHPELAYSLTSLGVLHLETGEPDLAEPYLREALAIREAVFDEAHWLIALTQRHLGRTLAAQQRFAEAEPLLLAAYEGARSQRGPDGEDTREAAGALAELYEAWGRPDEAIRYRAAE